MFNADEFILDALQALEERPDPQMIAHLYQVMGMYMAGDVLDGGCFDELKEFVYARNV